MELLNLMKNLTITPTDDPNQQLFRSFAADIENVHTEIVYAEHTDKTFLIISQYLKIGSMLVVHKDQIQNPLGTSEVYTTRVIFGASGEEQEVAARFLAEAINITKPLCIFINLKSYDIETLKKCRDIVLDLKKAIGSKVQND